jgi:hypothetical protein
MPNTRRCQPSSLRRRVLGALRPTSGILWVSGQSNGVELADSSAVRRACLSAHAGHTQSLTRTRLDPVDWIQVLLSLCVLAAVLKSMRWLRAETFEADDAILEASEYSSFTVHVSASGTGLMNKYFYRFGNVRIRRGRMKFYFDADGSFVPPTEELWVDIISCNATSARPPTMLVVKVDAPVRWEYMPIDYVPVVKRTDACHAGATSVVSRLAYLLQVRYSYNIWHTWARRGSCRCSRRFVRSTSCRLPRWVLRGRCTRSSTVVSTVATVVAMAGARGRTTRRCNARCGRRLREATDTQGRDVLFQFASLVSAWGRGEPAAGRPGGAAHRHLLAAVHQERLVAPVRHNLVRSEDAGRAGRGLFRGPRRRQVVHAQLLSGAEYHDARRRHLGQGASDRLCQGAR